jgi:D-alanyl-D-alanine carboxypeptidase (penicillin-binding protein 5/6)
MTRLNHATQCVLCALLIALSISTTALAFDTTPDIAEATGAFVMDSDGDTLYELNAYQEMAPASITKIMTAMVALDSGVDLDEPVPFVETEFGEAAQVVGYADGDTPTMRELLMATLVYSGNDAALNVAYGVAGSKEAFADLMNAKVAELGLEHTRFANPHGLEEDGHYSCAADLCVMGRYALENYPFIRDAVRTHYITVYPKGQKVTLESTDELMGSYDGLLGIKTGNTESGASFLGAARRNHVTVYSCALCCDTKEGRFSDTRTMLDWAFGLYEARTLAHDDLALRTSPWADGFWLRCPVSANRDVTGSIFCEGKVTYTTSMLRPSIFVSPHDTCGTTVWNQEGHHVESVAYEAEQPAKARAWNALILPAVSN